MKKMGLCGQSMGEGTHSGQQELEGRSNDSGVMVVTLVGIRECAGQSP